MKLLHFYSVFSVVSSGFAFANHNAESVHLLGRTERQDLISRSARLAGINIAPRHSGSNKLEVSSHTLQRRGNCFGRPGCTSPRTPGNARNTAPQSNRAPDSSTRSTGTQTVTPSETPKENDPRNTPMGRRTSLDRSVGGSSNSGTQRSNSFAAESRDKLGPLSRTNTDIKDHMSDLITPGSSRPGSAQSRGESASSLVSYADSVGMLTGEPFVPYEKRKPRAGSSAPGRPSSAGSAQPPTQPIPPQPDRPGSADSIAPKGGMTPRVGIPDPGRSADGSRRTSWTSYGSALSARLRWSSGA